MCRDRSSNGSNCRFFFSAISFCSSAIKHCDHDQLVIKVNMTISLAFLAPDLIKAAIDGRLPHGMGVARLTDLPAEWSRQREMLGFPAH
jgi:hypothetical protein